MDMIPDDAVIIESQINKTTSSWEKSVHMELHRICTFCGESCKFCINQLQLDMEVEHDNIDILIGMQRNIQNSRESEDINENSKNDDIDVLNLISTSQMIIQDMINAALSNLKSNNNLLQPLVCFCNDTDPIFSSFDITYSMHRTFSIEANKFQLIITFV